MNRAAVVVDTNVLVTANMANDQASLKCKLAAVQLLKSIALPDEVEEHRTLSIDDKMQIFGEYKRHANFSGQPGFGDRFFKWVHNHRYNAEVVDLVDWEVAHHACSHYWEASGLCGFDPSDRKFVIVALGSTFGPEICFAADTDWENSRTELEAVGIKLRNLCPGEPGAPE